MIAQCGKVARSNRRSDLTSTTEGEDSECKMTQKRDRGTFLKTMEWLKVLATGLQHSHFFFLQGSAAVSNFYGKD